MLPLLKELSEFSSITIAIETPNDEMALRLTPELSKPSERFSAATALRRFGLEVNFQVAPLLPYARRIEDVEFFAEKLVNHGDCTYVRSLADLLQCRLRGSNSRDPEAMRLRALSRNCGIEWLRKDSANVLLDALSELGSSSLGDKYKSRINDKQLSILYTPRQ